MKQLITILFFVLTLPAGLLGGESAYRIRITESRVGGIVVVHPTTGRLSLRHPKAMRSSVDTTRRVLVYGAYVPEHGLGMIGNCQPASLQPFITIVPAGAYGGRPVAHIEVDVLGHRRKWGASMQAFSFDLQFKTPMATGRVLHPPVGPHVENASWRPLESKEHKSSDRSQNAVDPQQWYHKAHQFVRVETSADGVAVIRAEDVLPHGRFSSLDSLALFCRGIQHPIYVDDADRSATLTSGDRIYFLGRRPAGDTSYLDEYDSTSVFYLTGSLFAEKPIRMRRRYGDSSVFDTVIDALQMHVRYERDTGYFHPGNGIDDDHGKLYTPPAALEGFYWSILNARIQQSGQYSIPFHAATDSNVVVVADLVTTLNSPLYDPDHAIDIVFPGSDSSRRIEVDGFGRHQIRDTIPGNQISPVGCELLVQATGFPDRIAEGKWASLILIDGVEIQGQGASILHGGRLRGRLRTSSVVGVHLGNLRDSQCVTIDTVANEIIFSPAQTRSYVIRAGLWQYREPKRVQQAVAGRYSAVLSIGDVTVRDDSVTGYAVARFDQTRSRILIQHYDDPSSALREIQSIPTVEPFIVINVSGQSDPAVTSELRSRGIRDLGNVPERWVASVAGDTGSLSSITHHLATYDSELGSSYGTHVPMLPGEHALFVGSGPGIEIARARQAKNDFISTFDWTKGADVVAIVYRDHLTEAQRWARHREKHSNVRIVLVDVESIFEAYGAGRHVPHAIRTFLQDAWSKSVDRKPTHCVLIGSASWDIRTAVKGSNVDARRPDQIPTYGRPSSDFWYGLLDDERDLITPELIVSRLPAVTPTELRVLVDKIIVADTVPFAPYQRRFLFAGGGKPEESFCEVFERMLRDEFGSGVDFSGPPLCIDTLVVCKEYVSQPGRMIRSYINEGVGLINFFGHGGTELFDIEDWSPSQLANEGRYPILATFSCLTGGYSSPSATCENAKYLFEPRNGASAAVGSTGLQYVSTADFLLYRFHEVLATTSIRAVGALTYEAKRSMALLNTTFGNNAAHQFSVLGDPFTRIRIDTAVQVLIPEQGMKVSTVRNVEPIVESDSTVIVDVDIWSEGLGTVTPVDVALVRTFGDSADTLRTTLSDGVCKQSSVRFVLPIAGMTGRHELTVTVDPAGTLRDRPEDNAARMSIDVSKPALVILEPEAGRVVHPDSLMIRVFDVLSTVSKKTPIVMAVCSNRDTSTWIRRSSNDELSRVVGTSLVDWTIDGRLSVDTMRTYWIGAWPTTPDEALPVAVQWQPVSFSYISGGATHHRLRADQVRLFAPDGSFDINSGAIVMPLSPVPLSVRSAGKPTADPVRDPYMSFRLRDSLLLENSFRQGLNILVFSVFDSLPRLVRRYDTSPFGSPIETGHDGYARECIAFLRDSVRDQDIVGIAACDESFTRFQRDGVFDEFKEILRSFGSKKADSLSIATSFAFIGSRAYKRLPVAESISSRGEVVVARVDVPFTADSLRVPLPAVAVRSWHGIESVSRGDVRLSLQRKDSKGAVDTLLVANSWVADDAFQYELLSASILATDSVPLPAYFASDLYYTPRPQILASGVSVDPANVAVLRGDTMTIQASILNARFTPTPADIPVQLTVRDTSGTVLLTSRTSLRLNANTLVVAKTLLPTDVAPEIVSLELAVDPEAELPMRYRIGYRTTGQGRIVDDRTSPTVELFADAMLRRDGDAVGREPLLEIRLSDNSRLPIESPDNLVVFVNGTRILPGKVNDWQFIGTRESLLTDPESTSVRAKLRFRFPMDIGENLVIIRSRDATGNPDTTEIMLRRPEGGSIYAADVYPNPARTGSSQLRVDVGLPDEAGILQVLAADVQGRRMDLVRSSVTTGRFSIPLESADVTLPNGFYIIQIILLDADGKTLSTATKKLVVTP